MRITNATPLVVAPVASRHPRTNRAAMTVALKGVFRLADGDGLVPLAEPAPLSGDVFRDDDPAGECLQASDFAWWKPRADLLLRGTCHAPEGKPVGVCPVRFAVGDWSKTLAVYGPRSWQSGGDSPGLAKPFTSFPLTYRASFGGPGRPDNPVGIGSEGEVLPRIESSHAPIKARTDTPQPAGFGPINPNWLPRQSKVGTYGGNYVKERWPGFPIDFDWSFFNAAPDDQQVPFLDGNEPLVLENLRPDAPRLRSRLPNWRVRCVIQQLEGTQVHLREVPLVIDTLVVDADQATLALTWRGVVEVLDAEMDDILEIFVMAESKDEPARSMDALSGYLSPTAPLVAAALALGPPVEGAETARKPAAAASARAPSPARPGAGPPEAEAPPAPGAAPPPRPTAPGTAPEPTAPPEAGEPPAPSKRPSVADLLAEHGAELQQAAEASADAYVRLAEEAAQHPETAPWAGFPNTPAPRAVSAHPRLEQSWQAAKDAGASDSGGEALAWVSQPVLTGLDSLQDFAARQPPPKEAPRPPTTLEVRQRLAEPGAGTAQELSGAVLAGEDFSGANLSGSIVRGADLSGLKADKAVLKGVVFAGSTMNGASLRGAELTGADFSGCDLSGADLTGATLKQALFTGACLRGARLDSAVAVQAGFAGADLTDASLVETDLSNADLSDSCLDGLKAGRANFTEATLHGCRGKKADFTGADVTRLRAGERVLLTRCRFKGVVGPGAIWQAANLTGSDFSGCRMPGAMFDKAALVECRFDGSDLAEARFRKATLPRASLTRANLFRGSMVRADLAGTDFSGANMFEVDFMDATLRDTLFAGTNLKKTALAGA